MSSYTPAPWTVDGLVTKDLDVISPDGRIAMIDCDGIDPDTLEANARLIASAPELLAALKAILRETTNDIAGIPRDEALDVISWVAETARNAIKQGEVKSCRGGRGESPL